MGRTDSEEHQCLYSTAIHLHPLWTVQTVQSLNASEIKLFLKSPYGQYSINRASEPVDYS